jgi:hypothetical protein
MPNNYNFNQLKKNLNKLAQKKNFNQPRKNLNILKENINNQKKNLNIFKEINKQQTFPNKLDAINGKKNINSKPKYIPNKPKTLANKVKSINKPVKKVRFQEFEMVNKTSSNLSNYILILFLIVISALCVYLLYEIYNTKQVVQQPVFQYAPNNYSKDLNKYIVKQNKYIMDINNRVREINGCRLHSSKYLRDKAILSQIRENERNMANQVALQQQYEPVLY